MAEPKIRYDIETGISGEGEAEKLAKALTQLGDTLENDLGRQAKSAATALEGLSQASAAAAQLQELRNESQALAVELAEAQNALGAINAELPKAAAATSQFATAEARAREALEGAQADLAEQRQALASLRVEYTDSARRSDEYREANKQLQVTIRSLRADVDEKKRALKESEAAAQGAVKVEGELSRAYEKAGAALVTVRAAIDDNSASQSQAEQTVRAAGHAVDDLSAAQRGLAQQTQQATEEGKRLVAQQAAVEAALRAQEEASRDAARALQDRVTGLKDSLAVERAEIGVLQQSLELQKTQQQTLLQVAKAKGDEAAATQAANRLREIEADQVSLIARGKRAEASALQETTDARRDALSAMGPLTSAQQKELTVADSTAQALRTQAAAADESARKIRTLGTEMDGAAKQGPGLNSALSQVSKAVAGLFAANKAWDFAKDTVALADAYGQMAERIAMATPVAAEYDLVQRRILESANLTYRPLAEQQELYIRTADALRSVGYETSSVLDITDSFSYLLTTNAASAERGANAIDAYAKAIQSGRVESDGWQSLLAATPTLVDAIARSTGRTTAEVRQLGITGKLSVQELNEGLRQSVELNKQAAAGMTATVKDAVTRLMNTWTAYVGEANKANQTTNKIAASIDLLSENLDTVIKLAITAGEVMAVVWGVKALTALKAYTAQLTIAAAETSAVMAATASAGNKAAVALAAAGKLAAAGWVGWEIGTFLRSEFETVEKAGILMAGTLTHIANLVQTHWEVTKAVFTDDTIADALERSGQRAKEIQETYRQMWGDANRAATAQAAAATIQTKATDDGAAALGRLGKAGEQAGVAVAAGGAAGADGVARLTPAISGALSVFTALQAEMKKPPPSDTGVQAIAQSLVDARRNGLDLEAVLRAVLPKALASLNGPELGKFREDFTAAMKEAGAMGADLRTGIALIGEQAAKSLGVDVWAASDRVSQGFLKAVQDLELLVGALPSLAAEGVNTGEVVAAALSKMIDGAKNEAEIQKVIAKAQALRAELGQDVTDGLLDKARQKSNDLRQAMEDARPGINKVADAMRALGITTDQALRETADKAKSAYDTLLRSGQASARELSEGFKRAADAAITASNGMVPEWVKSEAAARKYTIAVDDAGRATLQAADGSGIGGLASNWSRAADAANEYLKVIERVNLAGGRNADGSYKSNEDSLGIIGSFSDSIKSTQKSGETRSAGTDLGTLTGIAAFLKAAGVDDDATARKIALEFADAKGDIPYFNNPGQKKYGGNGSTISQALLKAAESYTFGTGTGSKTIPKEESSRTVTMNINLSNGFSGVVRTDREGESALRSLLSELERAQGTASYR